MTKTFQQVRQELDKLLKAQEYCKDFESINLVITAIEAKKKELDSIEYNEYLNGVLDPRD